MGNAAWTLVGAVIGAGFASGREIVSFFSRWGAWSFLAVAAAAAVLGWISRAALERPGPPPSWRGRWPEKLWNGMFLALMIVTGGAMISAAGEIAALTLPWRGAYWMGMTLSLLLALLLCRKTGSGLKRVSQALTACLVAALMAGLFLPKMRGVAVDAAQGWHVLPMSLWHGVCYGGFNGALAAPVLSEVSGALPEAEKRRAAMRGCAILATLLALGNAVMLRHPALMGEALPIIRLLSGFGRAGQGLGALALYLAMMSTLMACLTGSRGYGWLPVAGMTAVALVGFSSVVERLYPLLGGGCLMLLVAARREK